MFERIGRRVSPLELNLLKGSIAVSLLTLTLALSAGLRFQMPLWAVGVLLLSGAVGIGLGDTAYFSALRNIGVRRSLLLSTLAPPLTAVMGLLFLGEQLSWKAWLGVVITTAAVAWVITEQTSGEHGRPLNLKRGVMFGALFALFQSAGSILSRLVFTHTAVSPLESAVIRLAAGVALLLGILLAQRAPLLAWSKEPGARRLWIMVALVSVFGTYFAIWLQQVSFKLTATAVAQTLLATSPIFSLPIGWLLGEKPSLRAVLGILAAVGGVALLF